MKMNFTFIMISVGVLLMNVAHSQKGLSITLKSTPQFSFLNNETDENNSRYDRRSTFNDNFGVGAEYIFNNTAGVGIDLLYSNQGQKYTLENRKFKQELNYLKVPVYFIWPSNPFKAVSFLGKIGPQVSFLTSAELENTTSGRIEDDSKNRYNPVTFGGVANTGAQFRLSQAWYLATTLRFDYDFTNAEDDERMGFPAGRDDTRNSTVGLELALRYHLK